MFPNIRTKFICVAQTSKEISLSPKLIGILGRVAGITDFQKEKLLKKSTWESGESGVCL